ncbi:Synaptobrevin family protein [Cryptosporidium felis]|nr:Synaptobrevin family protein [Cryptosporidium felis]
MPIIYSLVARGQVILAEYTDRVGNFPTIARLLLKKINKNLNKQSYTYDNYCFHFLICEPGVSFMAMTDRNFGLIVPYEYLKDVRIRTVPYIEMLKHPMYLVLNNVVSPILSERMNVLIENIDILLERNEKLDLLVSQTKNLATESDTFRRQSHRFRQSTEWWYPSRRFKVLFCFVLLILGVLLFCKYLPSFNYTGSSLTGCISKLPNNAAVTETFITYENFDTPVTRNDVYQQVDDFIDELIGAPTEAPVTS